MSGSAAVSRKCHLSRYHDRLFTQSLLPAQLMARVRPARAYGLASLLWQSQPDMPSLLRTDRTYTTSGTTLGAASSLRCFCFRGTSYLTCWTTNSRLNACMSLYTVLEGASFGASSYVLFLQVTARTLRSATLPPPTPAHTTTLCGQRIYMQPIGTQTFDPMLQRGGCVVCVFVPFLRISEVYTRQRIVCDTVWTKR